MVKQAEKLYLFEEFDNPINLDQPFFNSHLITYIGNKRRDDLSQILSFNKTYFWGSIVDLFRTRIIDTELRSLVDSIKLIFEKFDIELAI